ncbi:copper chaperone PCu(A)C [Stenotrophomonas sp. MMGLT7]|uniref:copper chaperone PCu(A)C n=1 Tax=Stenotrophomonas sp. MMGLT7 TaxID=2901227 RepID=UPI002F91A25A
MDLRPFRMAVLTLVALAAPALCASSVGPAGCLRLEAGWARAMPAMSMAAGYGVLRNRCRYPVVVVAARSPDFGEVTLHESTQKDGISRMREIGRLPLAAGGEAVFRPGGLHLMLMRATGGLTEGARLRLSFELEDGSQAPAELRVARSAPQP